jgi:hypothetical protein
MATIVLDPQVIMTIERGELIEMHARVLPNKQEHNRLSFRPFALAVEICNAINTAELRNLCEYKATEGMTSLSPQDFRLISNAYLAYATPNGGSNSEIEYIAKNTEEKLYDELCLRFTEFYDQEAERGISMAGEKTRKERLQRNKAGEIDTAYSRGDKLTEVPIEVFMRMKPCDLRRFMVGGDQNRATTDEEAPQKVMEIVNNDEHDLFRSDPVALQALLEAITHPKQQRASKGLSDDIHFESWKTNLSQQRNKTLRTEFGLRFLMTRGGDPVSVYGDNNNPDVLLKFGEHFRRDWSGAILNYPENTDKIGLQGKRDNGKFDRLLNLMFPSRDMCRTVELKFEPSETLLNEGGLLLHRRQMPLVSLVNDIIDSVGDFLLVSKQFAICLPFEGTRVEFWVSIDTDGKKLTAFQKPRSPTVKTITPIIAVEALNSAVKQFEARTSTTETKKHFPITFTESPQEGQTPSPPKGFSIRDVLNTRRKYLFSESDMTFFKKIKRRIERNERCNNGKTKLLISLVIKYEDLMQKDTAHNNILQINTLEKTAEIFEPHGVDSLFFQRTHILMTIVLHKIGYRLLSSENMANFGPQARQFQDSGFCSSWSSLFLMLSKAFPNMDQAGIVEMMLYHNNNDDKTQQQTSSTTPQPAVFAKGIPRSDIELRQLVRSFNSLVNTALPIGTTENARRTTEEYIKFREDQSISKAEKTKNKKQKTKH